MRDLGLQSICRLLEQYRNCSVDNHGFVQGIHESWFENLCIEYEHYCKKHGLRPNKAAVSRKTAQSK
jgi:hypothetical protein